MEATFYEVLVGNIGKVHEGLDYMEAKSDYEAYQSQSKAHLGRASGEDVTLWADGDIIEAFVGSIRMALPA